MSMEIRTLSVHEKGITVHVSFTHPIIRMLSEACTVQAHKFFLRKCLDNCSHKVVYLYTNIYVLTRASLVAQMVKKCVCNAGEPCSISGSGRYSGEGNGYSLQHSCLANSMDRQSIGLQRVGY